jgi:hypothetical protein
MENDRSALSQLRTQSIVGASQTLTNLHTGLSQWAPSMNPMSSDHAVRALFLVVAICLAAVGSIMLMPRTHAQTVRQLVEVPATVDKWPASSKRFALVVGVDEYQDTQISPLAGAANDAKALAEALIKYAGFPQDQVILLASDQPLERRPTRGNILRRLSNLRGLVPEDGLLLVSFAGHGMERGGRGFLCPADAQISGDLALLEDTAIPVEVMRGRIRQTGVKQVVVILDACRNDPSGRGEAENKLTEAYARQFNFDVRNREVTAFATLYATEVGNVAYEYKEKKQGYFTWALVEGLKGAAANDKGEVTLAGLRQYLEEAVPKQVRLDLGQEKRQRPWAEVQGYKAEELVISVTVRVYVTPEMATGRVGPAAVELSFWESIGDWEGTLDTGNGTLRLVVHISHDKDGKLTGTLDSPDQGASGLRLSSITYNAPDFHFELTEVGGSYDGKFNKEKSAIEGQWKQGGQSLPLTLKPSAK